MLTALKNKYLNWIAACDAIAAKNYFTNVYGLARSLFALSILLTLLVNSDADLFNQADFINRQSGDFSRFNLFLIFDYQHLVWARTIAGLILISVISGYFPRYTGLLHWWVTISYYQAISIPEGGDQIAANVTFILLFITLMDSRKNHWQAPLTVKKPYSNFLAYLLFGIIGIQMAAVYFHSAVHKLYNTQEWIDGSAMYYWFNNTVFGLNDTMKLLLQPIIDTPLLLFMLNWGVIVFELLLFCAIIASAKTRKTLLIMGITFHFMIALTLGLYSFFLNMSACLILFLAPLEGKINFPVRNRKSLQDTLFLKKYIPVSIFARK